MYEQDERPPHFKPAAQPDAYDRAYGQAEGFPHTRPSTVTVTANVMGVGGVRRYVVQTFRPPDETGPRDMLFVEIAGPEGLQRIHLPAAVTKVIARQRDTLTGQSRSRASKTRAAADKAAGKLPGFMRQRRTA